MGKLILVRHGESLGNRERIFAVRPSELPLTELGYCQAREVAREIAARFRPEVVVTSPYLRARETARVIGEILKLQVEIEPDLYERDVGVFQGQGYDSIYDAPDFDAARPWLWKPKDGESYLDVKARVGPIHGGVMQTLWAHVTGSWNGISASPNCGLVLIEHTMNGYGMPMVIGDWCAAADAGG
jgi:broad specificity phosphatase PhoE